MSISDPISKRVQKSVPSYRMLEELRYYADYGHGFLGLFSALFEGNIEEVIKDPGPPDVREEDLPLVVRTLYSFVVGTEYERNIPAKYRKHLKRFKKPVLSSDSLFPSE